MSILWFITPSKNYHTWNNQSIWYYVPNICMALFFEKKKEKEKWRIEWQQRRESNVSPNLTIPLEKDTLRCNEELNEGRLHRQHLRDVTKPLTWREEREKTCREMKRREGRASPQPRLTSAWLSGHTALSFAPAAPAAWHFDTGTVVTNSRGLHPLPRCLPAAKSGQR